MEGTLSDPAGVHLRLGGWSLVIFVDGASCPLLFKGAEPGTWEAAVAPPTTSTFLLAPHPLVLPVSS